MPRCLNGNAPKRCACECWDLQPSLSCLAPEQILLAHEARAEAVLNLQRRPLTPRPRLTPPAGEEAGDEPDALRCLACLGELGDHGGHQHEGVRLGGSEASAGVQRGRCA